MARNILTSRLSPPIRRLEWSRPQIGGQSILLATAAAGNDNLVFGQRRSGGCAWRQSAAYRNGLRGSQVCYGRERSNWDEVAGNSHWMSLPLRSLSNNNGLDANIGCFRMTAPMRLLRSSILPAAHSSKSHYHVVFPFALPCRPRLGHDGGEWTVQVRAPQESSRLIPQG